MFTTYETQVVVIGGGATGTGILRDLALRGIPAILVEQASLAYGTSSRFHGLLHSGARYAVKDNDAARECMEENKILCKIADSCIEPTGGFFVQVEGDDSAYVDNWISACKGAGIDTAEKDVRELLKANPALSHNIVRAFRVGDCTVDGFRVVWGNVNSARHYGARIITRSKVTTILQSNGCITGVELTNQFTGDKQQISCQMVINAAGAWAGEIAALAGLDFKMIMDKGTLLAFNHRIVNQIVNRLRLPGDGDIFVPHNTITILGTTSITVNDPSCTKPGNEEVLKLLDIGKEVIPELGSFRLIRAFAGVRPLYQSNAAEEGRAVTRNFSLLDHRQMEGLNGFISIVGGKFTTYRLMAEKAVDLVAKRLGVNIPCRTAIEPLMNPLKNELLVRAKKVFGFPGAKMAADRLGENFAKVVAEAEQNPGKRRIFCECEQVSFAEIDYLAQDEDSFTLGDLRRKSRIGMGTCQGTFCGYRTLGALNQYPKFADNHKVFLRDFMERRWYGIKPILWGQQLREAQLSTGIYCSLFGMERMK